jgi:hypothetical protein
MVRRAVLPLIMLFACTGLSSAESIHFRDLGSSALGSDSLE